MKNGLANTPVLDEEKIAQLLVLRTRVCLPGEDVLGEIVAAFERDGEYRIAMLRSAAMSSDRNSRRRAAHALRGAASNLGALRVAALAQRIEMETAADGDVEVLARELTAAVELLRERLIPRSPES